MVQTMAWRRSERLLVVVHRPENPSNVEWQTFLNDSVSARLGSNLRIMVVSYGGRPDAAQREQLTRAIGTAPALTVVMTKNALVRAVAIALHFFNPRLVALALDDMEGAFQHLELSVRERETMKKLRSELEAGLRLPAES